MRIPFRAITADYYDDLPTLGERNRQPTHAPPPVAYLVVDEANNVRALLFNRPELPAEILTDFYGSPCRVFEYHYQRGKNQ